MFRIAIIARNQAVEMPRCILLGFTLMRRSRVPFSGAMFVDRTGNTNNLGLRWRFLGLWQPPLKRCSGVNQPVFYLQDLSAGQTHSRNWIFIPPSLDCEKLSSSVGAVEEVGDLKGSIGLVQVSACGLSADRSAPSTNCAQ